MLKLRLKWRELAFAFVGMVLGLVLLELVAGAYFFLEDRYWPKIPEPAPDAEQTEMRDYLRLLDRRRAESEAIAVPMQADEKTGWALRPNTYDAINDMRINSLGLRGAEIGRKEADELRILFIGDSSIVGVGCQEGDTMPVAAEQELAARLTRPVTGINGGVPGYDSGNSLHQLERLLPLLAPDWVVIGSLWSDCYVQSFAPRDGRPPRIRWLARTNTYRLLKRIITPFLKAKRVGWFASREEMLEASIADATTSPGQYRTNLLTMAEMVRRAGAQPLFLVLPAPIDLSGEELPPIIAAYRSIMRQVAADAGALLVDGPTLLQPNEVRIEHFVDAVHPGKVVQVLLGKAVAQSVADKVGQSH